MRKEKQRGRLVCSRITTATDERRLTGSSPSDSSPAVQERRFVASAKAFKRIPPPVTTQRVP
jgi:hypothetical protein